MTDQNLCNNEKVVSQNRPKQEVLVANFQQQQQQQKASLILQFVTEIIF